MAAQVKIYIWNTIYKHKHKNYRKKTTQKESTNNLQPDGRKELEKYLSYGIYLLYCELYFLLELAKRARKLTNRAGSAWASDCQVY